MGKGKPRHNPDKPQNKFKHCAFNDGTTWKECGLPWADKCTDNMYMCRKLYFQNLATLPPEKEDSFTKKYEQITGHHFGVPRTNYN